MATIPHKIKLYLPLLALLCLPLPSCTSLYVPQDSSQGIPALGKASLKQTLNSYLTHKPRTVQEMSSLLSSQPLASGSDSKGDYAHWYCTETTFSGTQPRFHLCWAACLSRNGKIITSCISLSDPNDVSKRITYGDSELYNEKKHPGLARVCLNHTQERIQAINTAPSTPSIGDAIATSVVTSLPGIINNVYAPAPIAVPSTPTTSSNKPEWLQMHLERQREIYNDAEATKQRILNDKAQRAGKINWGY